jgi:transposase-like protein
MSNRAAETVRSSQKRYNYLAFLNLPETVRRTFSTTNVVEAVNGQLERMRRNNGGYFHSQATLSLKLAMAVSHLESGTWRRHAANICGALPQINAMFDVRYQSESRS